VIRRRTFATLSIVVVALLLAALGAGWFPQEPLRKVLEQQLAQVVAAPGTGGSARVGRLAVVPALLKAELENLELEGGGFRVKIPRLRIQLAPAALTGELDIKRLELDSPTLEVWETDGEPAPASGSFPRLRIGDLQLRDGTLHYRSGALPGEIELRGVVAGGSAGPGTLTLEAAGGVLGGESPLALGPARAELTVSPAMELRLDVLELATAGSRFRAAGDLGRAGALSPRLEWEAAVDLAEVAPFVKRDLSGGVDATGNASSSHGRVRVEGEISGAGLNADGWPVDRMHARVQTAGSDADATIELALLGGRSEIRAQLRGHQVEAQIHLAELDIDRLGRRLAPQGVPVSGRLAGDLSLGGSTDGVFQSQGTLRASGRAAGFSLGGRAVFEGPLNLPDGSVDLAWSLEARADRSAENDVVAPWLRSGRLRARGKLQGAEPSARASLDASLVLDAPTGPLAVPVSGSARYDRGEAVAELAASLIGGTLSARVETREAALRHLQVEGEGLRLSQLLDEARGVLSFSAEGSGPLDRLSGSGDLRVDEAGWRTFDLGAVVGSIDASGARGALFFELPDLRLGARGQWQARPKPVVRATLSLEESPLALLQTLLPEDVPFDGTLTGTVELDVPVDRAADTVVQAQIDELLAGSGDLVARTTRAFTAALRDGTLQIDGLRMEGEGFRLDAAGSLGAEPDAPIDVELGLDVALADLPGLEDWALSGQLGIDALVRGPLQEPAARGRIRITDAGAQVAGLPRLVIHDGRLELSGSTLVIPELTADFANGSITAAGRIPLAAVLRASRSDPELVGRAEQADIRLDWTGLDAGRLIEALQPEGAAALSGALRGRLELRGGLAGLDELRGRLELGSTTLSVQDQSLELSPAEVEIDSGRLSTEGIAVSAEGGTFHMAGSVDLVDRTVELTGKGSLQLRSLSPFLAEASLSGEAETDISLTGPLEAPTPRGTLQVSGATLRIRDIPQAITDLNGRLLFDSGGLHIQPTTGTFGGGSLTLTGTASLEGTALANLALALTGQDIILRYPEGLRTRLDPDLTLSGTPGAFQLQGKVRVRRGIYDLGLALEGSLFAEVVEAAPSPLLRSIGLDVEIETLGPIIVHNNLADLQAGGRLVIRGDMETPAPLGRLEIDPGGRLLLQGREFVIESGRLAYGGTWNPTLAIEATTTVRSTGDRSRDFQITVTASGSLEQPRVAFKSSPSLTEREIVSLIVTGRESSEALSSSAWVAGEQAATLLTSRLSRDVARALQDLGIDEVSIQPELLARETEPGARFTFGKRLGQRLKLIYSQSLKDAEGRFIQLEGYPGHNVALLGQRQDDGSLTFGAGQRLSLGGPSSRKREAAGAPTRLSAVRFEGDTALDEESLRAAVRAQPDRRRRHRSRRGVAARGGPGTARSPADGLEAPGRRRAASQGAQRKGPPRSRGRGTPRGRRGAVPGAGRATLLVAHRGHERPSRPRATDRGGAVRRRRAPEGPRAAPRDASRSRLLQGIRRDASRHGRGRQAIGLRGRTGRTAETRRSAVPRGPSAVREAPARDRRRSSGPPDRSGGGCGERSGRVPEAALSRRRGGPPQGRGSVRTGLHRDAHPRGLARPDSRGPVRGGEPAGVRAGPDRRPRGWDGLRGGRGPGRSAPGAGPLLWPGLSGRPRDGRSRP